MLEVFYNIHDLVKIRVVGNEFLIASIDKHIDNFKSKIPFNDFCIEILPFSNFESQNYDIAVDDWIFYKRFAIRKARNLAMDLYSDKIKLFVDRLEIPLNLLVQLSLLKKGFSFVHAAGIERDGRGILMPAPPGVGKTSSVAMALKNNSYLLGDDLCIVGKGRIWSYPQSMSIYPYHQEILPELTRAIRNKLFWINATDIFVTKCLKSSTYFVRALRFIISLLGSTSISINPKKVFGNNSIGTDSPLSSIILIEREFNINKFVYTKDISLDINEITKILWHEWHASFHEILLFDALIYGPNWVEVLINKTQSVLEDSFKDINISKLKIPAAWKTKQLINHEIQFIECLNLSIE
jgi:hypothetical protein